MSSQKAASIEQLYDADGECIAADCGAVAESPSSRPAYYASGSIQAHEQGDCDGLGAGRGCAVAFLVTLAFWLTVLAGAEYWLLYLK
jgi:hypothetical protein